MNNFIKGFCQVDVLLAKILDNGASVMIVTSDSDFCDYLGSKMLLLKKIKHDMKSKVIKDTMLSSSNKNLGNEVREKLKDSVNAKLIHKEPKHDLLADENALETRALIALMIGSNQHIGGVKGVGVASTHSVVSKLKKINDSIKELLIKRGSQKLETDSSTAESRVQAIIREPAAECKPNVLELEKMITRMATLRKSVIAQNNSLVLMTTLVL